MHTGGPHSVASVTAFQRQGSWRCYESICQECKGTCCAIADGCVCSKLHRLLVFGWL
jgi:hypothetical protein